MRRKPQAPIPWRNKPISQFPGVSMIFSTTNYSSLYFSYRSINTNLPTTRGGTFIWLLRPLIIGPRDSLTFALICSGVGDAGCFSAD